VLVVNCPRKLQVESWGDLEGPQKQKPETLKEFSCGLRRQRDFHMNSQVLLCNAAANKTVTYYSRAADRVEQKDLPNTVVLSKTFRKLSSYAGLRLEPSTEVSVFSSGAAITLGASSIDWVQVDRDDRRGGSFSRVLDKPHNSTGKREALLRVVKPTPYMQRQNEHSRGPTKLRV
jgi:hypothetical protein